MFKKIFVPIIIILIFIVSVTIGFFITKQIIPVSTNSNELPNQIIEENNNKENQGKIVFTNYLYDKENPLEYTITEQEKIKEIKSYIDKIELTETDETLDNCLWKIEIISEEQKISLIIANYYNNTALISIQKNQQSATYKISKTDCLELVGFANRKYYLHESKLEKPSKNICQIAQNKALDSLSESEIKEVQKILRETHTMLEYMLIYAVQLIKEPDSPYWKQFNIDEVFKDPYSSVLIETRGFFDTVNDLKKIESIIKNPETKNKFKDMYTSLQTSMNNHDIEGCFKVHEIIHDYDYWIINYPAYFDTFSPTDWGGTDTYFGNIE